MKTVKAFIVFALFFITFPTQKGTTGNYFLSSEPIFQEKQGPLKDRRAFVFVPFIKLEDHQKQKITKFLNQSLKQIGTVLEKQTLTPQGADL